MARTNLPKQSCSFSAYLNSSTTLNTALAQLIFGGVSWNQGGAYNPITGTFTAPYTGKYLFTLRVTSGSAQTLTNLHLSISGNRTRDMLEAITFAINTEFSSTVELDMVAGQQLIVRHLSGTFTYEGGAANDSFYSQFQGHFLGGDYVAA